MLLNLIYANQYGAVKGSSTCHALVDMLQHWHIDADNCQTSRVLLLDYFKEVSDWLHLNEYVPHGSVLGPFIYVVMINGLVACGFRQYS